MDLESNNIYFIIPIEVSGLMSASQFTTLKDVEFAYMP
jgi:hypothetical protein